MSPSWSEHCAHSYIAPRARPSIVLLLLAALPITQHLAVIALFLAVFHGLLVGHFGAGQVGWTCCIVGILGWWVYRWGWARIQWQGSGQGKTILQDQPVTADNEVRIPAATCNSTTVDTTAAITSVSSCPGAWYPHFSDDIGLDMAACWRFVLRSLAACGLYDWQGCKITEKGETDQRGQEKAEQHLAAR